MTHRTSRRVLAATALVVAFAGPALAQKPAAPPAPFGGVVAPGTVAPAQPASSASAPDLAFGAFQRGYYVTALREAMKRISANPKDGPAMTLVAELYKDGLGVKLDKTEAARWYRLAANAGDRQATFALGLAYLQGSGVAKDRDQAKKLFETAAAQGHTGALYNLGVMAIEGEDQDFGKAAGYFRRAADGGDMDGAFALAMLYRAGKGVPQDAKLAADWLKKAADAHNTGAEVEYAIALFNGDGVEKDETLAARYFARAAAANNPVAQNRFARILAAGRGMPKNMVEAMKWHILARGAGVKDDWLDQQLETLSPKERDAVADAVRKYVGK